jgi:aconitate hydratase
VLTDDRKFEIAVRLDTLREQEYHQHGGILHHVLRSMTSTRR